jgi:hypothetical protein
MVDLYGAVPGMKNAAQPSSTNPADVQKALGRRDKRKVVQVEMLSSQYVENITPIITSGSFNLYAPGQTAPAAPSDPSQAPPAPDPATLQNASVAPSPARGYLITLNCTTPFAEALNNQGMVEKEFVGKLLAIKPDDKRHRMEYAVARASLAGTPRRIRQDEQKKAQLRAQYDAVQRAQAANQPAGTVTPQPEAAPAWGVQQNPQAAIDAEAFKDPLTGESMLDDWQFQILIAVVIDPNEFKPAEPGGPQASAR